MPEFLKYFLMIFICSLLVTAKCSAAFKINRSAVAAHSITTSAHPFLFSKARNEIRQLRHLMLVNAANYSGKSNSPMLGISSLATTIFAGIFIFLSFAHWLLPLLLFGFVFQAGGIALGIAGLGKHRRFKAFAVASLFISGLLLTLTIAILVLASIPLT